MADNFFLKALFAFVITCLPASVLAGAVPPIDSPGCDPDFYDVLEARSWLEGQREVEVASKLILKPDSVLEYSCFNNQVARLGLAANTMFSDFVTGAPLFPSRPTTAPRPPIGGTIPQPPLNLGPVGPNPPGAPYTAVSLNNTLGILVNDAEFAFNTGNFGHTYAGGTYSLPAASAACNPMQLVWYFIKCLDFNINDFLTFSDLALYDPRIVASSAAISCNDPNRGTRWSNALAAAFPVPSFPTLPGGIDIINPADSIYNTRMLYRATGCSAAVPIPTGVQVLTGVGSSYSDAVCSVPSCSYDGSGACN